MKQQNFLLWEIVKKNVQCIFVKFTKHPTFSHFALFSSLDTNLLFGKVLGNGALVDRLASVQEVLLDGLNAVTLDVASADQHTLQRTQAKVIVGLWRQLLITQPTNKQK